MKRRGRAGWVARSILPDVEAGDQVFYRNEWWRVEKVGRLMVALRAVDPPSRDTPKET